MNCETLTVNDDLRDYVHLQYQEATVSANRKIPAGTVSRRSHGLGLRNGEPLIVMMDALISYAAGYRVRFDQPLAEDGFLGDPWLQAAKGVRALLNGDGAVAMKRGITTDSKDNGAVEEMFWHAMNTAGFKEIDL